MAKKAMFLLPMSVPIILVLIIILGVALLAIAYFLSVTVSVNDHGAKANTALYAMLNSNECTPQTKLPFRDVLAVGIGEGKTKTSDRIVLDYGTKTDTITVFECLDNIFIDRVLPDKFSFYVEYAGGTYFLMNYGVFGSNALKLASYAYIALPNGDMAKVILKTSGESQ